MIYINLKGGLGNMMFQIAAAKSISISKKTDYSFPNLENHLNYLSSELTHNPKVNYCSEYLKLPFLKNAKTEKPLSPVTTISFPFHFEKINIPLSDAYIDGFFQSEKYFENYKNEIMDLFSPDEDLVSFLQTKYNDLLPIKKTSVHIRRGDYAKFSEYHYLQNLSFYMKAINYLDFQTDKFIIFSDDITWCKENFVGDKYFFVEDEKDYNELYLMSMCSNNIISNSSFSWWGAWLNKNSNKTVISPKNWFGERLQTLKTEDIIPETWLKM